MRNRSYFTQPTRLAELQRRDREDLPDRCCAELYREAPIGLCTLDEDGRIHEINLAAAELLGQPPESLRGQPLAAVAPGLSAPALEEHLRRCRERKARTSTQLAFERDGQSLRLGLVSAPLEVEGEPARLFQTAIIDLTGEKEAQDWLSGLHQQAVRDLRVRERFVALVSHDLANAAAAIQLSAEVAQASPQLADPENRRAFTARMAQAAEWIASLVRSLQDMAQLEAGALPVELEALPAASLPEDAVEILRSGAGACQVSIRVDIQQAGWVRADGGRITQVFLNLIGSAVKSSPRGSEVLVRAEPRDGRVLFTVQDRGRGIPVEDLEHVLARHWQLPRHGRPGVGLGLAIARAIIQAHGGTLGVESSPGVGTTCWFTLEAVPPPGGQPQEREGR